MIATASVRLTRLTPVMVVEAVEPCIAFWTDRLGFVIEHAVPGPDGRLLFASARAGDIEVMYQTRASVAAERPNDVEDLTGHSTALYITVNDLDEVERAMAGAPVVLTRHQTFYGTTEFYVRDPAGHMVGFAQGAAA